MKVCVEAGKIESSFEQKMGGGNVIVLVWTKTARSPKSRAC